jgi:hypothetical protein
MKYSQQTYSELDRLAAAGGSGQFVIRLGTGRLQGDVQAVDRIGCTIDSLQVVFDEAHRPDLPRLRELAQELCRQLRYLTEPLQVIEIDDQQRHVQARSQPPQREPEGAKFYELLLATESLTLKRFSAPRGQSRRVIAMPLTREITGRLAQDLADAAESASHR